MRTDKVLRALARGCTACAVLAAASAANAQLNEDWSSGTENGWTTSSDNGLSTWFFDGFVGEWFGDDIAPPPDPNDVPESQYLTSPTFTMGANFGLELEHWFDMENGYDGGVVEISVNGGAFTYLPDSTIFLGERYDVDPISVDFESHIGGLQAFTDVSSGGVGNFVTTTFDLNGFALTGDMVQVRFRLATDVSVADDGWYITRVAVVPLVDPTGACCFADGTCTDGLQSACQSAGGTFNEGVACGAGLCPVLAAGDTCDGATLIMSVPYSGSATALENYAGDTDLASCNSTSATMMNNAAWWSFAGTGERIRVVMDDINFDGAFAVFEAMDCASLGTFSQLGCSDPAPWTFDFDTQIGMTYYLVAMQWSSTPLGDTGNDVTISVDLAPPPPANNNCDAPAILSLNTPAPGTTVDAGGTDIASCGFDERDVWYAFLPGPNTNYRVFTTGAGSNMSVAVFQQECPPAGVEIACGDPSTTDASVDFTSDSLGSAVFIRAATDQSAQTSFDITIIELAGACTGTDGLCRQATPTDCVAAGGTFAGGDCGTGACCTGANCSVSTAGACADAGGAYQGDGTDCGSYSADDTLALNFEDISATGAMVTLTDDDVSDAQPLGFTFNYFGDDYTDAYISSNGFLTLTPTDDNGCCTGEILPQPNSVDGDPDGVIAFYWEDFDPPEGGTITVQTLGTAPNRRWIMQWNDINHYNFAAPLADPVTLQVKLFEGSNAIEFHYQSLTIDSGANGTHTIGIENQDGTVGLLYHHGATLPPAGSSFALAIGPVGGPCDAPPSCACETDGTAGVDVFDLLAYLDLWFVSASGADIDGAAGVDVFDLLFFLDCWFPASAGAAC